MCLRHIHQHEYTVSLGLYFHGIENKLHDKKGNLFLFVEYTNFDTLKGGDLNKTIKRSYYHWGVYISSNCGQCYLGIVL